MPNKREPTVFTDADVFAKPRSDLRTQMDDSIARHRDRLENPTTGKRSAFRFSIRDVLCVTTIIAMSCALGVGVVESATATAATAIGTAAIALLAYAAGLGTRARPT